MSQEPNKKNEVESESESEIPESFHDSPTLSSEESVTDEQNTAVTMRQKPNKQNAPEAELEIKSESALPESFHSLPIQPFSLQTESAAELPESFHSLSNLFPSASISLPTESESELPESFHFSLNLSPSTSISLPTETESELPESFHSSSNLSPSISISLRTESESELPESFHSFPRINSSTSASNQSGSSEETVTEKDDKKLLPSIQQQDITDKTVAVQAPQTEIDDVNTDKQLPAKPTKKAHKRHRTYVYAEVPPDRGFAWFMVFMTFFAQLMVDGMLYTNGFVLPYIAKDLKEKPVLVFMLTSLQVACFYFSIPFANGHINDFGCRIVSIIGVVLVVISFLTASIASHLLIIILFYGILGGMGLGMISISAQIVIGYYFNKYRSIAIGVSSSGAGAGVMIFSYLNFSMVSIFDWRVNVQVNAALMTFIFLVSLAYKQLTPRKIAEMFVDSDSETEEDEERADSRRKSLQGVKTYFGEMASVGKKKGSKEDDTFLILHVDPLEKQDILYTGPPQFKERDNSSYIDLAGVDAKVRSKHRDSIRSIHHTLSMSNMTREGQEKLELERRRKSFLIDLMFFSLPKLLFPDKVRRAYEVQFKFRLFNIREFVVLLLSACFYSAGFNIPFFYSAGRAQHLHLIERNMVTPFIGLVDMVICSACGFISYQFVNQVKYIFSGGVFFAGLITLMSGIFSDVNLYVQLFYSGSFAIAPAFHKTLRTVVYVRYLGIDNLTAVMGISYLGMSVGVLGGTTLGTCLYIMTESLSWTFMFSGICLMIAGILPLLMPIFVKQKVEKKW